MEPAQTINQETELTAKELERLTKEIYKQNVELAIRNKTLSVLSQVYSIINGALGVKETCQKLIESIVLDLGFQIGFISLIEVPQKTLTSHAFFGSPGIKNEEYKKYSKVFERFSISLNEKGNFCVESILENKKRLTNVLGDILTPLVSEKEADEIAEAFKVQTCVVYPLVFANRRFGVLVLGLDKHVGFLSRAEGETLKELIDIASIAIERSQIYADLKNANARLKVLDKTKDEFVSLASHELRTPLTAIKGYLWLLKNGQNLEQEKQKMYVDRVYNSSERLIHLVNDMLNVSRIETGRFQITSVKMDITKLAVEVREELLARAGQKGITLTVDAPKPIFVHADSEKVREVITNLVGNSLKFTSQGGKVSIKFEQLKGFVQTTVSDTGMGMKREDLKKLFAKFGRLDNSYTSMSEVPGTGLGLYICKKIVELSKGKIWAESEVGKGSRFYFTLPTA